MTVTEQFPDVTITQKGDTYTVTGKDAPALHEKLQSMPSEKRRLEISDLKDGVFTLQKSAMG